MVCQQKIILKRREEPRPKVGLLLAFRRKAGTSLTGLQALFTNVNSPRHPNPCFGHSSPRTARGIGCSCRKSHSAEQQLFHGNLYGVVSAVSYDRLLAQWKKSGCRSMRAFLFSPVTGNHFYSRSINDISARPEIDLPILCSAILPLLINYRRFRCVVLNPTRRSHRLPKPSNPKIYQPL